jgi:hypothetical protein
MTDEEIKEIEDECEAVTPGPWTVEEGLPKRHWIVNVGPGTPNGEPDYYIYGGNLGNSPYWYHGKRLTPDRKIAEFVAHSRTNVPALIAEIRKLRAALQAVEYADMEGRCPWCASRAGQGHAPDCERQAALGL